MYEEDALHISLDLAGLDRHNRLDKRLASALQHPCRTLLYIAHVTMCVGAALLLVLYSL